MIDTTGDGLTTPTETLNVQALSVRARRVGQQLTDAGRRTVDQDRLWELFALVDPSAAVGAGARRRLSVVLDELDACGWIRRHAAVDTGAEPPLPRKITVNTVPSRGGPSRTVRRFPWCPQLSWAADVPLSDEQFDDLRRIHSWLVRYGQPPIQVPYRERSAEIFGDEKRLDRLMTTTLFDAGTGRLDLDLLAAYAPAIPLVLAEVGTRRELLIIENHHTWASAVHSLRAGNTARWGAVAFGEGRRVAGGVPGLADQLGWEPTVIGYFGDLDPEGVRIAALASTRAEASGMPSITPVGELYRALVGRGTRREVGPHLPELEARDLATWLPPDLTTAVVDAFQQGLGWRQESLPSSELDHLLHAD